ncbi:MAG: PBECR4 domain-containing protein, partial [Oscillospiraceae bacterium]
MDILKESATKFCELLQKEYELTLGRKGKSIQIKIVFNEEDFKHLSGIHKLKDLDISQTKASQVFKKALNNNLKENDLMKSIYYDEIKDRLENLKNLET